jgi:hypothetical protein
MPKSAKTENEDMTPNQGLFVVGIVLTFTVIAAIIDSPVLRDWPGTMAIMFGVSTSPFLAIVYRLLGN